jgi:hypothetical protein
MCTSKYVHHVSNFRLAVGLLHLQLGFRGRSHLTNDIWGNVATRHALATVPKSYRSREYIMWLWRVTWISLNNTTNRNTQTGVLPPSLNYGRSSYRVPSQIHCRRPPGSSCWLAVRSPAAYSKRHCSLPHSTREALQLTVFCGSA